jgi:hypothetical protein
MGLRFKFLICLSLHDPHKSFRSAATADLVHHDLLLTLWG